MKGGELRVGATLRFAFNPIEARYLYKLPATAEIVEVEPHDRVTWEVSAPGFHALHSYRFAALGRGAQPLRLLGGGGGPDLPGTAALLAGPLPLRLPRVAGGRADAGPARPGGGGKRSAQSSCSTPQALITWEIRRYQPASTRSSTSCDGLHSAASRLQSPSADRGGVVELVHELDQQPVVLRPGGIAGRRRARSRRAGRRSARAARPNATACTPHSYSAPQRAVAPVR